MAEILKERDREHLKQLQQVTRHTDDIHDLRKEYVPNLFLITVWWLIFVGIMIFMISIDRFKLSDPVLIALVTTTTATVLGLFVIVAKWLFPPPKDK